METHGLSTRESKMKFKSLFYLTSSSVDMPGLKQAVSLRSRQPRIGIQISPALSQRRFPLCTQALPKKHTINVSN